MDIMSPLGLDGMRSQHMLFDCNSSTVKDMTATSRETLQKHLCCLVFDPLQISLARLLSILFLEFLPDIHA